MLQTSFFVTANGVVDVHVAVDKQLPDAGCTRSALAASGLASARLSVCWLQAPRVVRHLERSALSRDGLGALEAKLRAGQSPEEQRSCQNKNKIEIVNDLFFFNRSKRFI